MRGLPQSSDQVEHKASLTPWKSISINLSIESSIALVSEEILTLISILGEDSDYPVTELLDNSPQSRGWQSAKFCEYPQEIIVQFTNIVKLKQIQFLSHQAKIPQKIELYTFFPTGSQAMS